jgi:hypothetical protein
LNELKSFIGLLFNNEVFNTCWENIRSLFASDSTRKDILHFVINEDIFSVLVLMLKFYNPNDRGECRKSDPAATISQVFEKLVNNCQAVFLL